MRSVYENQILTSLNGWKQKAQNTPFLKMFCDKKFVHYTWISGAYSVLNIFLLWLFIDIWKIPTVISSAIVIGATFILRYVFFRWIKLI
jgi:putative flippase GtrA